MGDALNKQFKARGWPTLSIRVGIHTGEVLAGNIGSSTKMKYGCIGDPVNTASRLEGLCKFYGIGNCISTTTCWSEYVSSQYVCRKLDIIFLKGKQLPIAVYQVLCKVNDEEEKNWVQIKERYEAALSKFEDMDFAGCARILLEATCLHEDQPSINLLIRIEHEHGENTSARHAMEVVNGAVKMIS